MPGIFVAATDTGVGKTHVASAIARTLRLRGARVGVMKPAVSGCVAKKGVLVSDDVKRLKKAADVTDDDRLVCPVKYRAPLAPNWAARVDGAKCADVRKIKAAFSALKRKCDFLVVEGIGGLLVPLTDDYLAVDLLKDFRFPCVVVARAGLGTLNHVLLTLEALKHRKVSVRAVVFNHSAPPPYGLAEKTNFDNLSLLCAPVPVVRFAYGQRECPDLIPLIR